MPLIRFTKKTDMVRNHTKRQTMRKPRKKPLQLHDTLHVYTLEKLGLGTIISLKQKKLRDINLEDAHKDGFMTIHDCQQTIMEMHGCDLDEIFDIIGYDPFWKPNKVVKVD